MSNNNLLIIGAGGHGKCCYDIAKRMNKFDKISFIDDVETDVFGEKVLAKLEDIGRYEDSYDFVFVAIGNNNLRNNICEDLLKFRFSFVNLIDPSAVISEYSAIGKSCVIFPNVVIEAEVTIGDGCIIQSNTTIRHNSVIEEFALIYCNSVINPQITIKSKEIVPSITLEDV